MEEYKKENTVPIWHKPTLTLEEAATYSGIGVNTLRRITDESINSKMVFFVGTKRMIKRRLLEDYLENCYSV